MTIKTNIIGNIKTVMKKWFNDKDEIEEKLSEKAEKIHNHNDLYYTKAEDDEKFKAVDTKIDSLVGFTATVVDALPSTGEDGVIYLVQSEDGEKPDLYDEYIWIDEDFEKIGNTEMEVDLTPYATKVELETGLAGKSNTDHNHDDRYILKGSLDGDFDDKADTDHTHKTATTTENGFMSFEDKVKLNGIQAEANKYVLPVATAGTLGGVKIGENITITDGVISGTPNTTYSVATQSKEGLMSATDKKKLDELNESDEYVLPVASATILGGVKVGSNLSISDGVLSGTSDTTYDVASQSVNGLMSSGDKKKLDNISDNANKYELPTASSSQLGGIKVGSNLSISNGVLSGTGDTTYNTATQSANGLMSSGDKKKLDGIAEGATKITVDTSISSSSTNPVQNKVVYNSISGKATISPDDVVYDSKIEYAADDINNPLNNRAMLFTLDMMGKYVQVITDLGFRMGTSSGTVMARGGFFTVGSHNYSTNHGGWNSWKQITVDSSPTVVQLMSAIDTFLRLKHCYGITNGEVLNVTNTNATDKVIYRHFDWNTAGRPYNSSCRQNWFRFNSYLLGVSNQGSSTDKLPYRLHYCDSNMDTSSSGIGSGQIKTWNLW